MPDRANILHIFCDQLRADVFGFAGHPAAKTPNIDRLAASGTVFTRAYTPSPVCVPARRCMIEGRYAGRTGAFDNTQGVDPPWTFMRALTDAGYRTHGIGKCHFTPDRWALNGFQSRETQEELVTDPDRDDYLRYLKRRGHTHLTDPHGVRGEMYYIPQPAQMPAADHPTQWVGDRSVAFIEQQGGVGAAGDRSGCDASGGDGSGGPWYLFASIVHPHPPFAPPAPWHKLYHPADMPPPREPEGFEALQAHVNRQQNRYKYRDGWDPNVVALIRSYYLACVSFIDLQVGRMLDALDASGQADHTFIVLTADHGEHLGDYRCFGKRSLHDTAAKVPMIARLPGTLPAGGTCDRPANLIDLAPTFLGLAGTRPPASHPVDGESLFDIASGGAARAETFSQWQTGEQGTYAVVDGRHKLVYSAPDRREWLFDHEADPQELRDASGDPGAGETADRLRGLLFDHLRETGQRGVIDGDDWRTYPAPPLTTETVRFRQDHAWADQTIPGYTDG